MKVLVYGVILTAVLANVVLGQSAGSCETLRDVTEYFWNNDVNRLTSPQYTINWQSQVSSKNKNDEAEQRFFGAVDEDALRSKPTVAAFLALLDNYNMAIGSSETVTVTEQAEMDQFYSHIRSTAIFTKLFDYLLCRGKVSSETDFRSKFYDMWFNLYNRKQSSVTQDSSGLEHMIGEIKPRNKGVCGFHNWIRFYLEEKAGNLNYYGYVKREQPYAVAASFSWNGQRKPLSSFFIGTSPEFDLAVYTVCAMEHIDGVCKVQLGGVRYKIQTYDISHKDGLQIGSAFVLL